MPLITAPPDLSQTFTNPHAPSRPTPRPQDQNPPSSPPGLSILFSLSFHQVGVSGLPNPWPDTPAQTHLYFYTPTNQPTGDTTFKSPFDTPPQETPPSSLHSTHIHTHSSTSTSTHPNQQETTRSSLHSPYPTNPPVFLFYIQTTLFFLVARKRNNNNSPTGQGNHLQQGPYENDFYRRSRAHGHQHVLPGLGSHQHVLLLLPGWLHSALRGWATINTYYGGGLGLPR